MSTLTITRGLSASGKTTWAKEWVAQDPGLRARVNRDTLRLMIHDGTFIKGVTEQQIIAARDATITVLLKQGADVVCDDTNLSQRTARDLARLAARAGAGFDVHDLTHVPLQECLRRDALRSNPVGEQVIRDQHRRFLAGKTLPLPWPDETQDATLVRPYTPPPGGRRAVLADMDGTLALMTGRSPYDASRVHEDVPNVPVVAAVRAAYAAGAEIVVMSARSDVCRQATVAWLEEHLGVPFQGPFMRREGDRRPDATVKAEMFDEHVRDVFDVLYVLDDRDRVVAAWRRMGLTVFQVAPGDF
ncbi:AAA family ATPase [Planomonospora sp. ID82291]|uniref:phosphatase domain-containing protein n=1 Tax=Planomonospora sp. ID82291 TaxID=2738136 RepID=UPI0018C35918|nr:AAA family ATPase [Planomonospora sp. ID82291]MBG0818751.1 AAA family ATPase [Planomonospora sp. ID82291]